jgi:hypothetical protein
MIFGLYLLEFEIAVRDIIKDLLSPLKFKVLYYPRSPFYHSSRIPKDDFKLNHLRIGYATARTLCTYHLDKTELYSDIIASLLSHLNFITVNTNNYLQLKQSRLNRLRDFSKTTRVGELAQGINYLFVQDRLDFLYIIDFHFFCNLFGITIDSSDKSPDFVILNKDFSKLGLFESKGEASKTQNVTGIHGKLNNALNQLKTIINPCATVLFPLCTRFEHNGEEIDNLNERTIQQNLNSTIHYSVIIKECFIEPEFQIRIFKQHYASWFYLAADFERTTQLISANGIFIDISGNNYYQFDEQDFFYWVTIPPNNIQLIDNRIKGFVVSDRSYTFKIGIYKAVVDKLVNFESELNFAIENVSRNENYNYEIFSDGTAIKMSDKIK